jgi:protein involved in polysaccharide export with SLBB domain
MKLKFVNILLVLIISAILGSSCASTPTVESDSASTPAKQTKAQTQAPMAAPANTPEPSLAPGYLIAIKSSQDQNLNGTFRVDSSGELRLPYNVKVETNGMSFDKLKQVLENAYRPYFKGSPNLSISVAQRRYWVIVNGLVVKPGEYLVKHDSPLDDIISAAGGLGDDMDNGFVRVKQGGENRWINLGEYFRYGKSDQVPQWNGGELIFFQKEGSRGLEINSKTGQTKGVYLLGEVKTPGETTYQPGADFYYYLTKLGGPSQVANLDNVELVRTVKDLDRKEIRRETIFKGNVDDLPPIEEGDLLIINHDKQTPFERFLASAAAAASVVGVVVLALIVK